MFNLFSELREYRRSDLVWQIRHQFHLFRHGGVVDFECVAMNQVKPLMLIFHLLKCGDEGVVYLDSVDDGARIEEAAREGAFADADFEHVLTRRNVRQINDLREIPLLVQEVLAEFWSSAMGHGKPRVEGG